MRGPFESALAELAEACRAHYGDRLITLAVFGSVGRGTSRPDSDIDVLVVAEGLPDGRLNRMDDFRPLEQSGRSRRTAEAVTLVPGFSPVFKTPAEVRLGSPLFFDMIEDARILFDRGGFFRSELDALKRRLDRLGARRIWRGDAWFWDLKPDYKTGETFEI